MEKFCLKWNDFQENINSAFGNLSKEREFADVTLACENGQQVEAHKMILAASSPFFRNLLQKNKHSHPLIYMRGVQSEILLAIIDFLYLGEATHGPRRGPELKKKHPSFFVDAKQSQIAQGFQKCKF